MMKKKFHLVMVGLSSLLLVGCLSADGKTNKAGTKTDPVKNVKWSFAGDTPDTWKASIDGRKFELSAMSISESRFINWKVEANTDQANLSSPSGNLSVNLSAKPCVANATHHDYRALITIGDKVYEGCGTNQGDDLLNEQQEDDAIDSDADVKTETNVSSNMESAQLGTETEETSSVATVKESQTAPKAVTSSSSQALNYQVPKDATVLNISFSGSNPTWSGSLKGRAFQFNSNSEQISESRRLSWQGNNRGGQAIISSPDNSIIMTISGGTCESNGNVISLKVSGKTFNGCAVIH